MKQFLLNVPNAHELEPARAFIAALLDGKYDLIDWSVTEPTRIALNHDSADVYLIHESTLDNTTFLKILRTPVKDKIIVYGVRKAVMEDISAGGFPCIAEKATFMESLLAAKEPLMKLLALQTTEN